MLWLVTWLPMIDEKCWNGLTQHTPSLQNVHSRIAPPPEPLKALVGNLTTLCLVITNITMMPCHPEALPPQYTLALQDVRSHSRIAALQDVRSLSRCCLQSRALRRQALVLSGAFVIDTTTYIAMPGSHREYEYTGMGQRHNPPCCARRALSLALFPPEPSAQEASARPERNSDCYAWLPHWVRVFWFRAIIPPCCARRAELFHSRIALTS